MTDVGSRRIRGRSCSARAGRCSTALALPLRRRAPVPASVGDRRVAADDRGAVSARVDGQRHRRPRLPQRLLVRARVRASQPTDEPRDPALRRGRLPRARVGQRPARRHATKAATRRSRPTSPRALDAVGPQTVTVLRRGRSARSRPSRAASRTGSSSRTRSGIRAPPASGRRCGSSACARTYIEKIRWTPHLEGFAIGLRGARRSAIRADDLSVERRAAARRAAARRRPLPRHRRRGGPPHRAVRSRHRRLPQRAAVEPRAADADRRDDPAAARRPA